MLYVLKRRAAYDEAEAFVIRAATPHEARQLAAGRCGKEGPEPWLDSTRASCDALRLDGEPEVIVRDFFEA
jgi:hypothetical protein